MDDCMIGAGEFNDWIKYCMEADDGISFRITTHHAQESITRLKLSDSTIIYRNVRWKTRLYRLKVF